MPRPIQTQVSRTELVDVALGRAQADLVIENGRLIDVYSGEIRAASVAIRGERIAYVGADASHTPGSGHRGDRCGGTLPVAGTESPTAHREAETAKAHRG